MSITDRQDMSTQVPTEWVITTETDTSQEQATVVFIGHSFPELDIPSTVILSFIIVFGLSNAGVILCFIKSTAVRTPFNFIVLGKCHLLCYWQAQSILLCRKNNVNYVASVVFCRLSNMVSYHFIVVCILCKPDVKIKTMQFSPYEHCHNRWKKIIKCADSTGYIQCRKYMLNIHI